MSEISDNPSVPSSIKRIANVLRLTGWISFWFQLVLGVVSTIIFLFAIVLARTPATGTTNPGTGGGAFFAVCGLVALYFNVYQCFRYTQVARKLKDSNPNLRPKKADTIKLLKTGLLASMAGMLLSVLGAEAITGALLGKSLAVGQGAIFNPESLNKLIQPLDIFVVLANTHTITAHFGGIVAAIWLLNRLDQ